MIDASVEMLLAQQPDADPKELKGQIQGTLDTEIEKIRKHYPEFLNLPTEVEKSLRSGTPAQGTDKRIADAEQILQQLQTPLPGLAKVMLSQHNAGTLSPGRTELLAQMMVGVVKAVEAALE